MADDIKITAPGNPQNPAQPQGGQPVANQTAGGQNTYAPPSNDQLNPVIDLRGMDQKQTATPSMGGAFPGGVTPATPQPAPGNPPAAAVGAPAAQTNQPSAAPAAQGGAPSGRRASAIMLGEEEEGMQAPPSEKYAIPAMVKEKFPDLIQLIKETESMNDEERDYWFQILPIMTEEQIKKFRDILVNEKEQLTHLDQEYETELTKLNEKHMIEWKEFETKEKRKTLTAAESTSKEKEKSEEEELLKRLSQV